MKELNVAGIVVTGIFIMFILHKKNRLLSDYLLIGFNLIIAVILVTDIYLKNEISSPVFVINSLTSFYLFPTFLLYVLTITRVKQQWIWFYSFAFLFTLFLIADHFVANNYNREELKVLLDNPPFVYHVFYKGNKLFIIASIIWVLKMLREYTTGIKNEYSAIELIQLKWIKNFSLIYLIIVSVSLVAFLVYNFRIVPVDIDSVYLVVNACLVVALFYLSFNGIKQYSIAAYYAAAQPLSRQPSANQSATPFLNQAEKYKTSSLQSEDLTEIHRRLLKLFNDEKVFLAPELNIQQVAELVNVSTHSLSQTINTLEKQPFYDFVNKYRVTYLQRLLTNPSKQSLTILALGLESGFNSKASLNRIFKSITGQTPSEYRKTHLLK